MLKNVKIEENIFISRGDLFYLPFKDNCFDFVYSFGTLGEHVPLTNEIVSEVKRVLKPTGTFIFTTTVLKHRIGIMLIKRAGEKFLSKLSFSNNSSLHNWRSRFLTSRYANTKRSIYNTLSGHFQITHIENVESALHHYLVEAIPTNDKNNRGDLGA
jgi:SAM-dependent methyltransferase